jgi:site-specific DNA-cytosine methylase
MDGTYTEFDSKEDEELFNKLNEDIDIVQYVPVCAGLSMLNTCNSEDSKCRRGDPHNQQNQNMYETTKMVLGKINPKVAVFENAPAAYTASGAGVIEVLRDIAKENGYSMTLEKTDTFFHGVPQHRKRTFVYFWRNETAALIEYENKVPKHLVDYLNEIPDDAPLHDVFLNEKDSFKDVSYEYIMENVANDDEDTIIDVFNRYNIEKTTTAAVFIDAYPGIDGAIEWAAKKLEEAQKEHDEYMALPEEERTEEKTFEVKEKLKRYKKADRIFNHRKTKVSAGKGYWDDSCPVYKDGAFVNAIISKNMFRMLHPTKQRSLTIRELLFLMGMPHDYVLLDAKKNSAHITQSVPVATSKHIGTQCKLYVEGKLKTTESDFIKQNNEKQKLDYESKSHESVMDAEEW